MHGRRLYRLLGYVRLADYLTERLGMSLRRCQAILRLERALAGLPRLAQALAAGEVSVSKLEAVAGVATPETEATWLARAKQLPLGSLREAASRAAAEIHAASEVAATPSSSPTPGIPIEQDEPGRFISFGAPAPVLAIWHWTLDLVRRVAGQQEPAWRCAEFLAAEFLSGVPDTRGDPRGGPQGDPRGDTPVATRSVGPRRSATLPDPSAPLLPRHAGDAPGMAAWIEACAAVREALASIGASADPEAILLESPAHAVHADLSALPRDDELDAWELDAHLRRLVRLRQSLAWRQGRLLATFASLRLHCDLGFTSIDDWAGDRLAMSPRRARYLVSLAHRLRDLPLLADAYRRGLVSWCQARLLVRVARPATQSRWIRYARQVTVRRLEEVIIDCEVNAAMSSPTNSSVTPSSVAPAPGAPAHIGASPSPPDEPVPAEPAPTEPAPAESLLPWPLPAHPPASPTAAPADASRLHTSAPSLDLAAMNRVSSDRRSWRRISLWCPLDVASLWDSALRACRAAAGLHLEDWECFLLLARALRDTWENQEDPHWRRRYRILERDGWRCKAPGCTSRSGLNEHHIIFRSNQGGDDAENLVTLCVGHHQQGLHEGHIRCFGKAPDRLWWDMGVKRGGEPLVRYFGDRLVTRRPFVPGTASSRVVTAPPRGVAPPPRSVTPTPQLVVSAPRPVAPSPRVAPAPAGCG